MTRVRTTTRLNQPVRVFAAKKANTIALFGHSFLSQTGLLNGDQDPGASTAQVRRHDALGHFSYANVELGHRLHLVRNAGHAGDKTADLLARMGDVLSLNPLPSIVLLDIGINDISNGLSAATITANLQTIIEDLRRAGIKVAVATICGSGTAGVLANLPALYAVNDWIKDYCADNPDTALVDWNHTVTDCSSSTGQWIAAWTTDGTHPNAVGAPLMGHVLAQAIAPWVTGSNRLNATIANAKCLNPNPGLNGSNTAGAAGLSGQLAGNWNIDFLSNIGTGVLAKVACSDASGDWQQLKITANGNLRMYQVFNTGLGTTWNIGDRVYAECEFQADNDWVNATHFRLNMFGSGSTQPTNGNDLANAEATGGMKYWPATGVLRTPAVVIGSGTSNLFPMLEFQANSGTVRIRRFSVIKL